MKSSFDGATSNMFHRRLNYRYPVITHGKGIYLYDEGGKRYLDAVGGALVAAIGHGHKKLARRIARFAEKTTFLHGAQFTTRHMEAYARELCRLTPKGLTRAYFVSGGSDAVETALKLARQYHYDTGRKGRYKIIYTWPSYHGATFGALSVSGKASFRTIQKAYLVPFPSFRGYSSYRCPHGRGAAQCTAACAYELEKVIKKSGPASIAALIIEPIVGASGGVLIPPKGYFQVIQKICHKYHVLLIVDEVMTGFGRTGKWFACDHFGIHPDILVTAKGIAGGFVPLAAVFCTEKIYRSIRRGSGAFVHGFTFVNNAFMTGVGKVVLDYFKKHRLVARSARSGRYLLTKLRSLETIDIVGDVRGKGLMTAVEFVRNKKSRAPFPRKVRLAEHILQAAQRRGLILYFSLGFVNGVDGDAVMVAPPLNVTMREIDTIVAMFRDSIEEVRRTLPQKTPRSR